jgi:hypothetical protein
VCFEFYRLRFHFEAIDGLSIPRARAGNMVRGAFGATLRKLACSSQCGESGHHADCQYARIFEPRSADLVGPSGFRDLPRPFVLRTAQLDARKISPGELFSFDAHWFDTRSATLTYFASALAQLGCEGLGPHRGRSRLVAVEQLALDDALLCTAFQDGNWRHGLQPTSVSLIPEESGIASVTVRFVTATELKHGNELATRPEFAVLFARIRDRVSTLRALYGAGPLEVDFREMGDRAEAIEMPRCEIRQVRAVRRSTRTGQTHPLGGFTGVAEYRGELSEFLPYLRAARWTGIGRQTVWGKGEIRVMVGTAFPAGCRSGALAQR